jgi:hypothetical protein
MRAPRQTFKEHTMVTAKKASPAKTSPTAPVKTAATKKPTTKKVLKSPVETSTPVSAPAPKAAAKAKAPAKAAAEPKLQKSSPTLSEQQRNHYVQVAAFYIAERRGFVAGDPVADWAAAEVEVDRLIASGRFN